MALPLFLTQALTIPILKKIGTWLLLTIVIVGLAWAVYAGIIRPITKPNPTNIQTGGVSYNYQIKVGLGGCARLPVMVDKK
jgi:hypothetical protein